MIIRNLSYVLTWNDVFSSANLDFFRQKQNLCLSVWGAGVQCLKLRSKKCDYFMCSRTTFFILILFWSSSPVTIRENQSSGTILLDKELCSCSQERSKTSLHGWMQQALPERHGICWYPVTAKMYRISACIYSKLGHRAACNKSEQMQRTSEELSREGKRVEIKAFFMYLHRLQ